MCTACYVTDPCPHDSCHEQSCPAQGVQSHRPEFIPSPEQSRGFTPLHEDPNYAISCGLLACSLWGEGYFRLKPSWLSVSPCQIDLEVVFSVPLHLFLSSCCDKYHGQKKRPVLAHSSGEGVHIGEAPNVSLQC